MNGLHPVEAAWRRFRQNKNNLSLFREAQVRKPRLLQQLRSEGVLTTDWPPGVVLSASATVRVMKELALAIGLGVKPGAAPDWFKTYANTLHVWAAYRESKTIYRVEPYLAECLSRTTWPDGAPTEALRLPSFCPIFEFHWQGETVTVAATYDFAPFGPDKAAIHISRFWPWPPGVDVDAEAISNHAVWGRIASLALNRETLAEDVKEAADNLVKGFPHLKFDDMYKAFHGRLPGLVVTLLLYLGGDPDIVRVVHPGEKPTLKAAVQKRDPERYKDLAEPVIHAVGKSFTHAIERWEIEHPRESGDSTGRTVRPHTRRAHAHLYWTGEGRETPRVRFLLPISVKGGRLIEEPESPRVTEVR
jgi:hypothetical protein